MDFNVNVRSLEKCRYPVTLWTLASVHLAGELLTELAQVSIKNFAYGQSCDGESCDIYVTHVPIYAKRVPIHAMYPSQTINAILCLFCTHLCEFL
jgi:hypothetical protein